MNPRNLSGALVFAAILAIGSAHAACTNASLVGTFGFVHVATDGAGHHGTSVGQVVFDGNGNSSGTATRSVNGTISTVTSTGAYSVSKNCTASATIVQSDNSTVHFNFVLDDGKKGYQMIETDAGNVNTGLALAQGKVTCGLTGVKHTFAANLTGTNIGTGPVGYVGQLILDGNGSISGNLTLNVDGSVNPVPVSITGTYTENAGCAGTAAITPNGLGTGNFSFVVVNSGKEVLMIETDENTVVSGTLQQ